MQWDNGVVIPTALPKNWDCESSDIRSSSDVDPGGYQIWPVMNYDYSLRFLLTQKIASAPTYIRDASSRRALCFRLCVETYGFSGPLVGTTVDGQLWPTNWRIDDLAGVRHEGGDHPLVLPAQVSQTGGLCRLLNWVHRDGCTSKARAVLELSNGATDAEIAAVEYRTGASMPREYAELLRISNGMLLGPVALMSAAEAFMPEHTVMGGVVVIVGIDLRGGWAETFYCVPRSGRCADHVVRCDADGMAEDVAPSLKRFVDMCIDEIEREARVHQL